MQYRLARTIWTLLILIAVAGPAYSRSGAFPISTQDEQTIVLPYMAVGGELEGWHFLTVLSLENSHRLADSGTIEFFTGEGRPFHVQLNDSTGLAARSEWKVSGKDSTLLVISHPGGSFEDGWVRIRHSRKDPIKAIVLVQCYNGKQLFAEAGAVGHPGELVNSPYYRISTNRSSPWRRWNAPANAPRIALLGPLGAGMSKGQREVEELTAVAQALSQGTCNRLQQTGVSTAATVITETGYASWYADRYHGRISASGTQFNQSSLTAAHRTLPFGTKVKITNLRNGCSVNVRIVDRGPFVPGRIVDLSSAAARRIDIIKDGVSPVRLETMPS